METQDEAKYIKSMVKFAFNKFDNKWSIGLTKDGNSWKWVNDMPVSQTYWANGQPSGQGNYGIMASDGTWFDDDGTQKYGVICEYESGK